MTLATLGQINCKNCSKSDRDICSISGKKLNQKKMSVSECPKFNNVKGGNSDQ